MTKVNTLLFLFFFFLCPVIGNNCSCAEYINNFCQAAADASTADYYIITAKVTEPAHGPFGEYMQVEVMDRLHHPFDFDTIIVLGQDGLNCGEFLGHFSTEDILILGLYRGFFTPPATDTFYLHGCGLNWLRLNGNVVNGQIRPDLDNQDYEDFKDGLIACMNISTDTEEIIPLETMITIIPNPAHDRLYLQSTDQPIEHITIFSMTGQQVFFKEVALQQNSEVDLQDLPAGIYFVRVQMNGQVSTQKVVKN